jgi:hypothetical protein
MVTPSSHRRLRHPLLCGRLPLPLRPLPRRVLGEGIGRYLRIGLAGIWRLALKPVELHLEARLRIGSPPKGTHGNFELPAAKCADPDGRGGAQPFGNSKTALDHGQLFLGLNGKTL